MRKKITQQQSSDEILSGGLVIPQVIKLLENAANLKDNQDKIQKQIDASKRELGQLKSDALATQKELKIANEDLVTAKKDLELTQENILRANEKSKQADNKLSDVRVRLTDKEREFNSFVSEAESKKKSTGSAFDADSKTKTNSIKLLAEREDRISEQLVKLEMTLKDLEIDIKGKKEAIKDLDAKGVNLSKEISGLEVKREELKKVEGNVNEVKSKLDSLEGNISDKQKEVDGLNAQLVSLKKEIESAEVIKEKTLGGLKVREEKIKIKESEIERRNVVLDNKKNAIDRQAKTLQKHLDKLEIPIKVV